MPGAFDFESLSFPAAIEPTDIPSTMTAAGPKKADDDDEIVLDLSNEVSNVKSSLI